VNATPFDLVPFSDRHLDEAAALLAQRHRRDRAACPLLPARFEEPAAARAAVEAIWRRPGARGVAALDGGLLAGYLIGDAVAEPVRGRCAWVRLAGHALAEGVDAELYRDLYARLATGWVAQGYFDHYALVPAGDRTALDAWFALSFGLEHAHGLRALAVPEEADAVRHTPGLEIRRATADDRETLADVSQWLRRYQAGPPIWGAALPEDTSQIVTGYTDMAGDEAATVWLAFRDGQVAGFQAYFSAEMSDDNPLVPPECVDLSVAATHPDLRGRGVGSALTQTGLADAAARGYTACVVDWRVTNLISSRFWPRQGFQPAVYRLVRRVDPRIVWAQG
jgi:ribosomal protein S18 acetylase RimI-like enzyme